MKNWLNQHATRNKIVSFLEGSLEGRVGKLNLRPIVKAKQ